ncbi:Pollen receptor-like kinase [Sesamum alatum]|uniref:Pollen receptor-like kinase n=1 Tax=Sesamum alatum TaxID=300844 RepID=A0AAE1XL64_9LAMI|nr:Pollen receptor-like kinase [Sesamum alatum]
MAIIHVLGSSIFFYVFLLIFPTITSSVSESEALLKLKGGFTNATVLDSWRPGTEPCAKVKPWVGVICDKTVVSALRLGHLGLSGKIDVDALLSLPGLRSLGFMSNAFSGPIPEFHRMGTLKALFLSKNQFSGEIPSDYFTQLMGLRKVWLSGNRFSGPIPSSLGKLSYLMELHLEDNQFSGPVPSLVQQSLFNLDLSNNNLEGQIPAGMMKFPAHAFKGNPELCGWILRKPCNTSAQLANITAAENKDPPPNIFIWVLVASTVVFLLMAAGIYVLKQRQDRFHLVIEESPSISASSVKKKDFEGGRDGLGSSHRIGSSRKGSSRFARGVGDIVMLNYEKGEFGLADLMKAAAEVLGNGALGSSYKAVMASGLTVVVKRIKEVPKMGRDHFDAEMRRLACLNHENVLPPLAYHYRKDEKLFVYEYQATGSLLFLLHGDRGTAHEQLNWPVRLKIIQGIARGLDYLHAELSLLDLPHGDLKSSNVLLTPEYEPLLTDYGFCALVSSSHAAQAMAAYKSPEAVLDHYISPKCDVFCLGVIILEILTGKFPYQSLSNGEGGTDLVQWVRSAVSEGKEADLFDPDITSTKAIIHQMEQLLHIGIACTQTNPDHRLDLAEAISRIEGLTSVDYQQKAKAHVRTPSSEAYGVDHYNRRSGRRPDNIVDQSLQY